jgi:hypothetical protein
VAGIRRGFTLTVENQPEPIFLVNCRATDWYDYASYLDATGKAATVGCDFAQNPNALNGPGAKGANAPGLPNYPDHGPIRYLRSNAYVLNRSRLASYNGWGSTEIAQFDTNQPCIRACASDWPLQDVTMTETDFTALGAAAAMNPANARHNVPAVGVQTFANNYVTLGAGGAEVVFSVGPYVARNNIIDLLDTDDSGSLTLFKSPLFIEWFMPADHEFREVAPLIERNTIRVRGNRTTANLIIGQGDPAVIPAGAIYKIASKDAPGGDFGGYTVRGAPSSVDIPVQIEEGDMRPENYATWRIWRHAAGETMADAVAEDTVASQDGVYRIGLDGQTPTNTKSVTEIALGDSSEHTLTVALAAGTFADGDVIYLSRERTDVEVGAKSVDGVRVTTGLTGRFPVNNPATAIAIPDPEMVDNLIVIEGDWNEVRLRDGDGAVTDLTPYRPATWGMFDGAGLVPQTGNAALGAASEITGFDWTGAQRLTDLTLGALKAGSSLSGVRAPYQAPALPGVDWTAPGLTPGVTVDADDVTITGGDAGGDPALSVTGADVIFLKRTVLDSNEAVFSSVTPQVGDLVTPALDFSHPALGRRRIRGTTLGPVDPGFAPQTFTNNGTGSVTTLGGVTEENRLTGKVHIALRIRFKALPGANNLVLPNLHYRSDLGLCCGHSWPLNAIMTPTVDQWISLLLTQEQGVGFRATYKDGTAAVSSPLEIPEPAAGTYPHFETEAYLVHPGYGGVGIEISHAFGIWQGGDPSWSDFFEADGAVKQWLVDPTRGVADMEPRFVLWGLDAFRDPEALRIGAWEGPAFRAEQAEWTAS